MKTTIYFLLVASLVIQKCQSCCQSYSNCCSSCNYQPQCCANCCQQAQCCSSGNCCKQNCTSVIDPCTNTTRPPTTTTSTTPLTSTPGTEKPGGGSAVSNETSNINNDNNVSINANVNLKNDISNTNRIYIPVRVSNRNMNVIGSSSVTSHPPPRPPILPTTPSIPPGPILPPIIESTTLPTKYIYPILVPIPYPYPIFYPLPQQGCCTVVQPCLEQHGQCHHTSCGGECVSPYMFSPVNPCQHHGCSKRSYWERFTCDGSGFNCGYVYNDCSSCNFEFYREFSTYQHCRGCFY